MRYVKAAAACAAIMVLFALFGLFKLAIWGGDARPGAIPLLVLFLAVVFTWRAMTRKKLDAQP
jgi:hypothetical protein